MLPPFARRPLSARALLVIGSSIAVFETPYAQPAQAVTACLPATAESQLVLRETKLLGKKHAEEHARARAQQCEAERGLRPVPAQGILATPEAALRKERAIRIAADDLASGQTSRASASTQRDATTASKLGRWSDPFSIPVVGITSVVLHTGKVMFWSYDPASWLNDSNTGVAYIWDPATWLGYSIQPPENIWCAGQTVLADGRVFIAGGNLRYPDPSAPAGSQGWAGTQTAYTFDAGSGPGSERWVLQPYMVAGRWYPTTTKLADGRVVITSGYDETGSERTTSAVELFTPAPGDIQGTMELLNYHNPTGLYPLQFVLLSGKMLEAGPWANSSYTLNPIGWGWDRLADMHVNHDRYGNGIIYTDASVSPAKQVVMLAGGVHGSATIPQTTVAGNEWLDGTNPAAGWQWFPQWLQVRHNSSTVILPDGSLLTVGGNKAITNYDEPVLDAELYPRPATDPTATWQKVAPHSVQAAYHSAAVLLPDATVLLSQDDMDRSAPHKAQVYSPPYLFKGARPNIAGAPEKITYGESFNITLDNAIKGAASAILIAPGATTHGNDMHQRAVKLPIRIRNNTITATLPSRESAGVLPPGYYMLFVLDKGIPSVAKFVHVS